MRKIVWLIFILSISLAPQQVLSQQPAGPVIQDIHRRNNPAHPGYQGGTSEPQQVWENRFGSFAMDTGDGSVGVSEDESSIRAARSVALQRCGTNGCKIMASIRNGCLAAVYGGGVMAVAGGENMQIATETVMRNCSRKNGGAPCEHYYSHCSLPVRIR